MVMVISCGAFDGSCEWRERVGSHSAVYENRASKIYAAIRGHLRPDDEHLQVDLWIKE